MRDSTKTLLNQATIIFNRHKWIIVGLIGVSFAFIGGAGLRATAIPWLLSADAPFHLDYAWQVYKGNLPVAMEGVKMPIDQAFHHIHLTAHHPPLYYAILAPFVGPFLANGEWQVATAMGRLLSLTLGLLSALSLAWLAWVIGGRYKRILAISAPAVAITFVPFVGVSAAVYSDTLVILTSTIALALSILILKQGPRLLYLGGITVVLVLGLASKVSFVSALFLALLAVIASFMIHGKEKRSKNIIKGVGCAAIMGLAVVLGIGWFYYFHNFEVSGSLRAARPPSVEPSRTYKPFTEVITSKHLWSLIPLRLFGRSLDKIGEHTVNYWTSLTVFVLGIAGSIAWFIKERVWHFFNKTHKVSLLVAGILIAHFGIIFAQQIVHATGYGAINPRYLLSAWGIVGLVLAFGVSAWYRLRGAGTILVLVAGLFAIINTTIYNLTKRTKLPTEQGWLHLLQSGAEQNGFPAIVVPLLLMAMTTGVALIGIALWQVTKKENFEELIQAQNSNEGQKDTAKIR